MSVQVRPLADRDFFPWLGLYAEYGDLHDAPLTDDKALLLWSWLTDKKRRIDGVVAVDDDGNLVGLAHFREFLRPLYGDFGIFLDDLYVASKGRRSGVAHALMEHVKQVAAERGATVVDWVTDPGDEAARQLSNGYAQATDRITYELRF